MENDEKNIGWQGDVDRELEEFRTPWTLLRVETRAPLFGQHALKRRAIVGKSLRDWGTAASIRLRSEASAGQAE
jgi:hypothetical protein